jgi:transcriptional regulator of acetoin/glycerol metabolism
MKKDNLKIWDDRSVLGQVSEYETSHKLYGIRAERQPDPKGSIKPCTQKPISYKREDDMYPCDPAVESPKNNEAGDDRVRLAWENVVLKDLPPMMEMKPEVLISWQRCRELGVDPYSRTSGYSLSKAKLQELIDSNRDLVEVSKPILDMIEISVRGTGFIVTLTEKNGYVLLFRGEGSILEMAERNFFMPGCLRSIEHAGTNAIGICLKEGKPVQITGAEHYKLSFHSWTCSAAPIYDGQNRLVGVINLSGQSGGQHKHTLALVRSAAETIESRLRERDLIQEKQRLNLMLTSVFNSFSDGVIIVDSRLMITSLNLSATRMLEVPDNSLLGKRLHEIIQPNEPLIQALQTKQPLSDIETSFLKPCSVKSYICRIDYLKNTLSEVLGAIVTLTEKRRIITMAKNLGGNYAKYDFKDIKGHNLQLRKQIELAMVAARTNSRVLITGESGTGKELFAQAIHCYSNRRNEPFVAISCATIPRDLIEAELFGYQRGAFTGARREGMVGKFELANKGTLFLDEINGLPLDLQAKLLRVLQQNEILKLGDSKPIPVDVRIIAASNTDLIAEVDNNNFREDLYYRINVVEISIPPLRDRIDDLELLIAHIMDRHCMQMHIMKPDITKEAFEVLREYCWPGNVRELENCIERALILSQGRRIEKHHLPERLWKIPTILGIGGVSLNQSVKALMESALRRSDGNVTAAAKDLRIARSTFYRKMRQFGLS